MARASSVSRAATTTTTTTTSTSSSSKETLSDKLGPTRRSTRKRLSLTSETSHSTAASSNAMPLNVVAATPISPQQPFHKKKSRRSTSTEELGKSRRRRRSSVSRDRSSKKEVPERNRSFSSSSVTNFDEVAWDMEHESSRRRSSKDRKSNRDSSKSRKTSSSNKRTSSMSSSSRLSSSQASSRGRTRRSSTSRKERPPSPTSSRKRVSSSKTKRGDKRSSTSPKRDKRSSRSKPRRSNSHQEQSLMSFMQKEDSVRPRETEEALETKSAFTSISRSRNRTKPEGKPRRDDWALGATYHGGSNARRNTRSFRDMMAAKAAQQSKVEEQAQTSFRRSFSADLQQEQPQAAAAKSFRRSISDDHQHHHSQQHQSMASLPVLQEEKKKSKKSKSKKSSKSHRKTKSVQQELSDFLEECNTKRRKEAASSNNNNNNGSSPGGDRSCVSMPALMSNGKHPGKSSLKLSPPMVHTSNKYRSSSSSISQSDHNGPLIEKLGDKGGARARSSRKSRQHHFSSSSRIHSGLEMDGSMQDGSSGSEKRRRSKSSTKETSSSKSRKKDDRPRSLSRSRRLSQTSKTHPASPTRSNNYNKSNSPKTARKSSVRRKGGLQKIFSIRDLKSELESTPAPMVFHREDTSSAWAPRTPSSSQRGQHGVVEDDNLVPETPPPPLAPHSPLRSLRSTDDEWSEPSSTRHGDRRASTGTSDEDGRSGEESETDYLPRRGRRHSSALPVPPSILKNRNEPIFQTSGDDTAERPIDLHRDHQAAMDYDAEMGTEEDVFSHYTWGMDDTAGRQQPEEVREERGCLKGNIRESLLFTAFEAFDL